MIRNNPYSQGGWSNFNPDPDSQGSPSPSAFGALPTGPTNSSPMLTAFTFFFATLPDSTPSILNAHVYAPHARPYLRVVTDPLLPDYTIIKDTNNLTVALIGWAEHPFLELDGYRSRTRVKDWLPLSAERNSSRTMVLKDVRYTWVPCSSCVCLYNTRSSPPTLVARITRAPGQVVLEVNSPSSTTGLTEYIVATVLLMCDRSID